MPITPLTVANTPFHFLAFSGFNVPKAGAHSQFDATNVRADLVATAGNNGPDTVAITKNVVGRTIYLSYFTNEISSVRLPNPPPAGVNMVTTDNLSGCKIFLDRITGSNDVIFYHANAKMHAPPSNHGAVHPATESGAATAHLDNLHAAAQLQYQTAGVPAVSSNSLAKPFYNHNAHAAVQRKIGQGRVRIPNPVEAPDPARLNSPEFIGGTVVFGFWIPPGAGPGRWDFYYQTWGDIEYRRPGKAPKGWIKGRNSPAGDYRVIQHGQIAY